MVLIAALSLAAWPLAAGAADGAAVAVITSPAGESSLALDDDAIVEVEGERGDVQVVIEGGTVRVARSGCPDQVCVHTGEVSASGAVIACVPNGVVIRVGGGADGTYDARVR